MQLCLWPKNVTQPGVDLEVGDDIAARGIKNGEINSERQSNQTVTGA
jgi:hypothetical protein